MALSAKWLGGVALALAVGLAAATGGAVHYRAQAGAAQVRVQRVEEIVNTLKRELSLRQPLAPDVVLAYTPAEDPSPLPPPPPTTEDRAGAEVAALQARIATLEADLRARGGNTNRPGPDSWPSRSPGAGLAELQRSDPERYAEFVKRREDLRRSVNDAIARQALQLLEAEPESLPDDERQQRNVMLQLVNDTWKLAGEALAVPPPENRRDLMRTIHENLDALSPMFDAERDRQFRQLALESGYNERDATLFVDHVNSVIESTSTQPLRRSVRRGWGGGPPPPAPSPPTPNR